MQGSDVVRAQQAVEDWAPPSTPVALPGLTLEVAPAEVPLTAPAKPRVIAVVSPKGGLGKTTVAANLAIGLARLAPEGVALVDCDLQFGDVANVLALEPTHTLPDLVTGVAATDDLVLKTLLTPSRWGVFTACGALSPADGESILGEQLTHLVEQLSRTFQYVVIDTTPALGEHTLAVLDVATDVVAVSSLAVPNLRALRVELAILREVGLTGEKLHLVLNQAVDPGGLQLRDGQNIVGEPFDVVLPHSKAVPLSTNRGVPVLVDAPKDGASKALTQLLARITGADSATFRQPRKAHSA